ncbi:MAG: DUF2628 domain-containing protein [Lachnospiraceae bacterium]|nr:DUF2628 domain-containing protein [Lachnospiraceae bacterium]
MNDIRAGDNVNGDWLTEEEAKAFIGKNSSFYLEKWGSRPDSAFKGWNWAAMLFSIEWMAYRKMYLEAFLYFIIITLISMSFGFLFDALRIGYDGKMLGDIFRLMIGFIGNALYRKKAERTFTKTKSMSAPDRLSSLRSMGGVSVVAVVVCIILEIAIVVLPIIIR